MNVAGLDGFFRPGPTEPNGLAVIAAGVAGYFLALGNQGPTGGLFTLAYEHVPGFVMMREPWIANPAAQQGRSGPPP